MSQINLSFELSNTISPDFLIFYEQDLKLIEDLFLPKILRFNRADKFDTKFIETTSDIWSFNYSGRKTVLNFSALNTYEKK